MTALPALTPCPLCAEPTAIPVSSEDRYRASLLTVACPRCGLYRNDPLPTIAQLQAFHEVEYRKSYKGRREPKPKNVLRSQRLAAARLVRLKQLLPANADALDAGSGSGEFLSALNNSGFQPTGLEADTAYADYARREYGVTVHAGGLLDAQLPANAFNAITLFHVLEHQPDPLAVLNHLKDWLREDGLLVIEVPNLSSPHQHPAKRFHFAHVLGFTPESLSLAAHLCGFVILELRTDSFGRNLFAILRKSTTPLETSIAAPPPPLVSSAGATLRYYLLPQTYLRFALRMAQFAGEAFSIRRRT